MVLPRRIDRCFLTSLLEWLVKTRGRMVKHARYYWTVLAEGHLSRRLFGSMLIDCGAAPAGRVVNRERHRMERLEVFQRGQVLALRLGWTRQTDQPRSMQRPK